ncbi:LCP family glycopolymer transferase [Acetivibrio cellulolyticus]|uniref:LCP family glycopolymer transferase n=1 Tax=Acetivibrio cellulolyticus TaxID=35830 RepID=UPI0001E2F0D6|nr:LCP family protein [Acetivibrio cellulolyticus]
MKCIYDMEFIFLYNDNSLSLEEMKKFEEHLDSCERCRGIISRDKSVMDFIKKEESMENTSFSKAKLMDSIPFGMYSKNTVKYRVLSLFNKVIPSKPTLVKVAVAVIMLALILNNQAIISNISNKADSILNHKGVENAQTHGISGVEKPRLTEGKLSANGVVSRDSTNVMIIGEDKPGVYDTIGVLSIDEKSKNLKIIMISRDVNIDYSSYVENKLSIDRGLDISEDTTISSAHKIASQIGYKGKFQSGSVSFLSDVIKERFGITVDQYVKLEFDGLSQIVDLFGGVDIDIPYGMNYDDPAKGLSIHLKKGMQHLDGKNAECFVRYSLRYPRYGSSYNSERDNNQAAFIKAFIKQKVTASNIDKLPQLFNILDKNMEHSFDIKNSLEFYIQYLKDLASDSYTIDTLSITDDD